MHKHYDIAVIGAGAAGMMCAATAGRRGRSVVLIDHAQTLGEKIRISGGGRCNFTNTGTLAANFISQNPDFCRSALARYTPADFIALVRSHNIAFHEKHKGQLFCDGSSEQIIDMLRRECDSAGVVLQMPCTVETVSRHDTGHELATDHGPIHCTRLVIATGGLSIPKIGATDFGHRIARQFGLKIIEPRPALVPLTFTQESWAPFVQLAGVSIEVEIATGKGRTAGRFTEGLLFTHRGLSGPAVLQISSYWNPGEAVVINLVPQVNLEHELLSLKQRSTGRVAAALAAWLPRSLAEGWVTACAPELADKRLADTPDRSLRALAQTLSSWTLVPSGTEGFRKAEVTRGGVDTRELSSTTMEAKKAPGLYFIGEVVDVTGWLGGYNFQWAWASGVAAGIAAGDTSAA